MAIICRKCNYEISRTTITVYTVGAIAAFITTVLPYLPKPHGATATKKNMTTAEAIEYVKGMADDALTASANILKLNCPTCSKYEYWEISKDAE
ncbi:MAG: hypothetical protein JO129_04790 [Candidatus Dependentiae bacterium]|nr:hypothetical protein [Candidatus Dependentiae bacterium]